MPLYRVAFNEHEMFRAGYFKYPLCIPQKGDGDDTSTSFKSY